MAEWVNVGLEHDIKPNQHIVVDVDDVLIVVFNIDGNFYALEDLCSHEAYPLSEGEVADGTITCALHGARFCIKTGAALTAPAYAPVTCFPVRVMDGMVQVMDDRWD